MERSRKLDPEIQRLLDDLLAQTARMEKRLNEIEQEVGGARQRSADDH